MQICQAHVNMSIKGPSLAYTWTLSGRTSQQTMAQSVLRSLSSILSETRTDLDKCVNFWLKHSIDANSGGFYNCIGEGGEIYDETKYGWLQGRQVWMLAKLYNEVPRFHTEDILHAAKHGCAFLQSNIKSPGDSMRCYFAVTRGGKPLKFQRTIFTESFYAIAMSEMYRATQDHHFLVEATRVIDKIIHWAFVNDSELSRTKLSNDKQPACPLNEPLIIMGILEELYNADILLLKKYADTSRRCMNMVLSHSVQVDDKCVIHEYVDTTGEKLPGSEGHLMNPGHAIEAGWFLILCAERLNDQSIVDIAIKDFILNPLEYGWDDEMGGIYYFLDSRGFSPTQLEWNMKLWWPHNEALISLLMAYDRTGSQEMLDLFIKVHTYYQSHFRDETNGESYGYLTRTGAVSSDFKGGPFKGEFNVNRDREYNDSS